jgi:hypothetical protein
MVAYRIPITFSMERLKKITEKEFNIVVINTGHYNRTGMSYFDTHRTGMFFFNKHGMIMSLPAQRFCTGPGILIP